ncbi:MAG: phage tail sheath family protein [Kofleriaceae bacterium]|nr:phage tail sheath family protein [Myxococcales bacterium]MCB9561018.1 phage tail sheath family protein [Kofleriaceae bacterium]MCB9574524.1 phage tail sheath family protein [Kofleriaceae bacterium]
MRPPGVYAAFVDPARPTLEIADTRVTGFVGLTLKGPLHEPTRIANWDEFVETYGYSTDQYLSDAVFAFFRNGGSACYVVRVAHTTAPGEQPSVDDASCAEHVQADDWNKPSLRIRALNEGRWGNSIWVKCLHSTGATALLTRDLDVGSGEAHVNTVRGFEVGALVRLYDRENSDYVVVTEVGDKLIKWSKETPVNRRHRAAAPTHLEVMEFEIHVALRDRREVFKNLQMHPLSRNYAPRVVASRSRLIRVEDLGTRSPVPHNLPEPQPMVRLAGGRDGADAVTPEDFIGIDNGPGERAGLLALGAMEEVALLAAPDAMLFCERERGPAGEMRAQRIQEAMVSLCENQKDRFAILDIPPSKDIEWVQRWRRHLDSSYCAYYWPWLTMVGPEGGKGRAVPPSGVMAGIYAQRDTTDGVHSAPANVSIIGAEDLSLRVTEDHLGILNASSVNTFRIQRGVRPWGARTASTDPDWRYINVRRLFIMLRRTLDVGFSWVTFEPNSHGTWAAVQLATATFLESLWKKGMLIGGKPEEAFFVQCDAETNPADNIDKGILTCNIGVAPTVPSEFVMISMVQDMGTDQVG